ncbi:MOSC domain-containing protein [Mesobacillus subterraneus]|uniref:MOSC domain-containing protein n=1 Tax=Mesobacillus subterraneus TaxID=285983 RepID=A0A427TPC6_9BACI|nr:MOSC domain-containing protein [Mesobacillus subterraneus]RSD26203.1 MOSC domain-containing protein [Mesobacillus subterraneus]
MAEILYLHVGLPEAKHWNGKTELSAICKKSVSEAFLSKETFSGDGVAATEFHGGPDRAVCFYPIEHYSQWSREFVRQIKAPTFGENISAQGMMEANVYIGDIYRLGEATVQVSQGRVPCSKISKNNGVEDLLKRVVQTGYTGYFFRVLEEGVVRSGSPIKLLDRSQENFSILKANELFFHQRKNILEIEQLLEVEALAEVWKENLQKLLKQNN